MNRVYPSKPYAHNCLGSLSRTANMYLRQYQFPETFDQELDIFITADSDRIYSRDSGHSLRCFSRHTKDHEVEFEKWIRSTKITDDKVIEFLKDILKADVKIHWTGYRVMGSVHQGNGSVVWTFQLFAKHPKSQTEVYTGEDAPNVERVAPTSSNY